MLHYSFLKYKGGFGVLGSRGPRAMAPTLTSSERDDDDSDSSDERSDATSHFTAVFTASAVEYDARDVKDQLEIRKAVHILESMIKKP